MFHFFSVSRKGTGVLQQWEEQEVESLPSILLQYVAKGEVGLDQQLRLALQNVWENQQHGVLLGLRGEITCLSADSQTSVFQGGDVWTWIFSKERSVMLQRGLYRNVAKFGFTAYHSGPCPFSLSLRIQVFFFPTDLFFPSFTSVCLDLFCFRLIWLVMTASLCQVLIWSESENQTFCLPATL